MISDDDSQRWKMVYLLEYFENQERRNVRPPQNERGDIEDDLEALRFRYGKQDLLDDSEIPVEVREQRRQAIIKIRIMQLSFLLISVYLIYKVLFDGQMLNK